VRVLIAEDSVLLRAGLTRLLLDAGEEVVATVGDAGALLEAVERHQPDLALVDVRMPPTNTDDGLRASLEIRRRWPPVGILVLSQYVEEQYAIELLAGQPAGLGYLLKDRVADVGEFVAAARRVAEGGLRWIPRSWPSCWPAAAAGTRWPRCRSASARSSATWRPGCPTRPSPQRWW
jgi:DNA-binding NarL/FixJ family response regulator